ASRRYFHQWLENYETLHKAWLSSFLPTIPSTSGGGYRPQDLWDRLNPCQDRVFKEEFAYAKARWFYENASTRLDVTEEMRKSVLEIPNLPRSSQNELTHTLPSFPNQLTPFHSDPIRTHVTSYLRSALTRFLHLAFCNGGLWHACAGHMGATVWFLAPGLALWILGIYTERRELVGGILLLIWAGFWIMLMCTNKHCFAMWLTADARQLYPHELVRPLPPEHATPPPVYSLAIPPQPDDHVAPPPSYKLRPCRKASGMLSLMNGGTGGARTEKRASGGSRILDLFGRREEERDLESGIVIELDIRRTMEQSRQMDLKLTLPPARKTKVRS
ncbi:hypothetical protein FRC07_002021, partial [Ceratobasidium sp. 392]